MPMTGKKVKIALTDFPKIMTWEEANKACKSLGKGWRLPTVEELKIMYKYRKEIGGFCELDKGGLPNNYIKYWSSTLEDNKYPFCISFSFTNQNVNAYSAVMDFTCCVRAVKTAR